MRGRWLLLAPILALAMALVSTVAYDPVDTDRSAQSLGGMPDNINPMRGQFDNIGTGLFPQSNPAQQSFPDWPGTKDASIRVDWRTLQPTNPTSLAPDAPDFMRYDFSEIDAALETYAARGMRVGLRVSSYNSCCETSPEGNVNVGVPGWLAATPGATAEYDVDGIRQVVPSWNDNAYMDNFVALLAALGRRYNLDERVSVFEMSGYGDFSENHVAVMRDELAAPGPEESNSEEILGYYSQYRDQYITKENVIKLVDANLRAFKDTQMVTSTQNPEIVKQLLRDSAELSAVTKPVGLRADCLGVASPVPTWAGNEYSEYVKRQDPIIAVLLERFTSAPVLTEWCQKPEEMPAQEYYERGLSDVIDNHVSMTASSGFPDQFNGTVMTPADYRLWSLANDVSGYRYNAEVTEQGGLSGGVVSGVITWENLGVAATHENWVVTYQLRDRAGSILRTSPSAIVLTSMFSAQSYRDHGAQPVSATAQESVEFDVSDLDPGFYTVAVVVEWADTKPEGTNPVRYDPMTLSQNGRGSDGAYTLAAFEVP